MRCHLRLTLVNLLRCFLLKFNGGSLASTPSAVNDQPEADHAENEREYEVPVEAQEGQGDRDILGNQYTQDNKSDSGDELTEEHSEQENRSVSEAGGMIMVASPRSKTARECESQNRGSTTASTVVAHDDGVVPEDDYGLSSSLQFEDGSPAHVDQINQQDTPEQSVGSHYESALNTTEHENLTVGHSHPSEHPVEFGKTMPWVTVRQKSLPATGIAPAPDDLNGNSRAVSSPSVPRFRHEPLQVSDGPETSRLLSSVDVDDLVDDAVSSVGKAKSDDCATQRISCRSTPSKRSWKDAQDLRSDDHQSSAKRQRRDSVKLDNTPPFITPTYYEQVDITENLRKELDAAMTRCWLWCLNQEDNQRIEVPSRWLKGDIVNDMVHFATAHHDTGLALHSGCFPIPRNAVHDEVEACRKLLALPSPATMLSYPQLLNTNHWVLVQINMSNKTYSSFDSLPSDRKENSIDTQVHALLDRLDISSAHWQREAVPWPWPLQADSSDCGVFTAVASLLVSAYCCIQIKQQSAEQGTDQHTAPPEVTLSAASQALRNPKCVLLWRAFLAALATETPLLDHIPDNLLPRAELCIQTVAAYSTSIGGYSVSSHNEPGGALEDLCLSDLRAQADSKILWRQLASQSKQSADVLRIMDQLFSILHHFAVLRKRKLADQITEIHALEASQQAQLERFATSTTSTPSTAWVSMDASAAQRGLTKKILKDLSIQRQRRVMELAYLQSGWARIEATQLDHAANVAQAVQQYYQATVAQIQERLVTAGAELQKYVDI